MKMIFIVISLTGIIFSGLLTSCSKGKQIASSKPTEKLHKDTTEITRQPTTGTTIQRSVETPDHNGTVVFLPPPQIKDRFTLEHASATETTWVKENTSANASENTGTADNTANYKAFYSESGKKNWVTYSETGLVVEERHELLVDQLPQNLYNSIKQKYPDSKILSASTYKHLKKEGSYAVVIKSESSIEAKPVELILRENGSYVE